eukprot:scaffold2512_cov120-Cylindrotheca_fusiformis.AAC.7
MKVSETQGQLRRHRDEARLDRCSALRNHRISFNDAVDPDAERVTTIDDRDILFGRGKRFQDHDGNKRMREIVEKYKEEYHLLNRRHKRSLVEKVYREIVEGGARFLTKLATTTEDCFVLVDGEVALQKVNNTLRSKKRSIKIGPVKSTSAKTSARSTSLAPTLARAATVGHTELSSGRASAVGESLDLLARNQLSSELIAPTDILPFTGFNGYMTNSVTMPLARDAQVSLPIFNYYSSLRHDLMLRESMILQRFGVLRNMAEPAVYSSIMARVPHSTAPVNRGVSALEIEQSMPSRESARLNR